MPRLLGCLFSKCLITGSTKAGAARDAAGASELGRTPHPFAASPAHGTAPSGIAAPAARPHTPQPQGEGSVTGGVDRSHRCWAPELVQRFADGLTSNEVACTLRLVNKAAAAQFNQSQHKVVRLSLPVPYHAFVWRWCRASPTHSLTRQQRKQLPCLVARSGSIANLEVLLAGSDAGYALAPEVADAAAGAGQLEVCRFLQQRGGCYAPTAIHHAAKGRHWPVYEWCLENVPCCADHYTSSDAARGGHVGLMDWLLLGEPNPPIAGLLAAAAAGCDLATLQRLHQRCFRKRHWLEAILAVTPRAKTAAVVAAACSHTADWRAKVEWLEVEWYSTYIADAGEEAARLPDGVSRLQWLRERGYTLSAGVAAAAAEAGNVGALRLVLEGGAALGAEAAHRAVLGAAEGGHLAVLQALPRTQAVRQALVGHAAAAAAERGHLLVVVWLAETQGAAQVLTVGVFRSAVRSGSMELLAWLHARGCPWDASVFTEAVEWVSEQQLEWLAARGCPMGVDGEPYMRAATHADLPMLRCLRGLGCPWGPGARIFTRAIKAFGARPGACDPCTCVLPALWWLIEKGCPVDWDAAVREARAAGGPGVLAWVEKQRRQRGPPT